MINYKQKVVNREIKMNVFDIIGPVMVGPSSSHTAGAVKIGYVSRKLMGESIVSANLLLYGSFWQQERGMERIKPLLLDY